MDSLQRWHPIVSDEYPLHPVMEEDANGDYVDYLQASARIAELQARVRELEELVKEMIPMPKLEVEQDNTLGTVVRMNDVWIWHDTRGGALELDSANRYRNRIDNALKGTP